jgi:hypothetical protein
MSTCAGIRADGARCRAQAIRESEWCFNHHPNYEDARKQRASKGGKRGGRGRPQAELAALKDRLITLGEDVLAGTIDRSDAAVAGKLWSIAIGAILVALKAKEVEELEARLAELEAALEAHQKERSYGLPGISSGACRRLYAAPWRLSSRRTAPRRSTSTRKRRAEPLSCTSRPPWRQIMAASRARSRQGY